MRKILIFTSVLFLTFSFFSCSDDVETQKEETNAEFIENAFKIYNDMRAENANVSMRLGLNNEGKVTAKYEKTKVNLVNSKGSSPELLCSDDTYSKEFSKCVKKNVDLGMCVVVVTCAYCAYECDGGDNDGDGI